MIFLNIMIYGVFLFLGGAFAFCALIALLYGALWAWGKVADR